MTTNEVQKLGKYDITGVLGQGGMGIVYKGIDPGIGRPVVIKMMTGAFAGNPELVKRFQREAQSAGTLFHPNIVVIYELGTEGGNPYIAMEYLDGESLEHIISSHKRISLVEKIEIMVQVLNGLQYAHENDIVHRDIKPANIMILKDGKVKIVDFGIAHIVDNSMTMTGQILGTPNYMSPEQVNGHVVDGRSDIWSAGVVFYAFLTGALPFEGPSPFLKILNDPPPPLKNYVKDCPPELETIVNKALAKDREERYASAGDFAFDLARLQERLKKDMVLEYIEQARVALGKSELTRAKDLVLEVIKFDPKNVAAQDLKKEVEQHMAVLRRQEDIRRLRASAEEALATTQLDRAQSLLQQALTLDKTNPDLLKQLEVINQAKQRKDLVDKTVLQAKALQEDGDLESALRTVEEALAIDDQDTSTRNLRDEIAAQIKKRELEKQLNELLDRARKETSAAHFTAAWQLIRKAEGLAPEESNTDALRTMVSTSREQERRRIQVETTATEIETALYREGLTAATKKLEAALKKYPGESALTDLLKNYKDLRQAAGAGDADKVGSRVSFLGNSGNYQPALTMLAHAIQAAPAEKLKTLQTQVAQAQSEVTEKAASAAAEAEKLLHAAKADEAVSLLESQPMSFIYQREFCSVLEKGRAAQDKLVAIETAILQARRLMAKGELSAAWDKAKALLTEHPQSAVVQQFVKDLEAHRAAVSKNAVEKAIRDAKTLMRARQAAAADRALNAALPSLPVVAPELRKMFESLRHEVKQASAEQPADADMAKTMIRGSATAAVAAPATQVTTAERTTPEVKVPPQPAAFPVRSLVVTVIAIAVIAIGVAIGGWYGYKKLTAPLPLDSYVDITAVPWAKITTIVSSDGKMNKTVDSETPLHVALPSGEYTVTMVGSDGKPYSEKVTLTKSSPKVVSHTFEAVSANDIVQSSN